MAASELVAQMQALGAAQGREDVKYSTFLRAKVVAVRPGSGPADADHPKPSLDVQPLRKDGAEDADWPVIPDVPVDVLWPGAGRGVFGLPPVGAVVRLGFEYRDPSRPFIAGFVADGYSVPDHGGDLVLAHSDAVQIRVTAAGVIEIRGMDIRLGTGAAALVRSTIASWLNGHTHLFSGTGAVGTPTTPWVPGGDESQGVKA